MAIREALVKAERQLKPSKRKYWYKIPGISKTTSATDIKRAYKWLALQWHSDKNVENHEEAENMFRDRHDRCVASLGNNSLRQPNRACICSKGEALSTQGSEGSDVKPGGSPTEPPSIIKG
ncbi:hypothetical protein ZWY2020_058340 [Hordeum vulgare]|nr:hypothetical protein ZWY2020_058340 [Hordeum vulgare]